MIIDPEQYKKDLTYTIRDNRNQLLQNSDKYMLQDYPISNFQRSLVINYRKELRDFFQTSVVVDWLFTLENQEFPSLPTFPDLNKIEIIPIEIPIEIIEIIPIEIPIIEIPIEIIPIEIPILTSN